MDFHPIANVFPLMEGDEFREFMKDIEPCEQRVAGVAERVRVDNPVPPHREPCHVCGKYRSICQWHHLVSVREAAEILCNLKLPWAAAFPYTMGILPLVSLCPTHHRLLHALDEKSGLSRHCDLISDFSPSEFKNFGELANLAQQESSRFLYLATRSAKLLGVCG